MKSKKVIIIVSIVVVLVVAISGISVAAWHKFTSKPTGNWDVTTTVPVDVIVGATVGDGAKYKGQDGEAPHGFFKSIATVELTATRDIVLGGVPVVSADKPGTVLPLDSVKFVSKFVIDGKEQDTLTLVKDVMQTVTIEVIFPNLSDLKYQGATFSIKVNLSEAK